MGDNDSNDMKRIIAILEAGYTLVLTPDRVTLVEDIRQTERGETPFFLSAEPVFCIGNVSGTGDMIRALAISGHNIAKSEPVLTREERVGLLWSASCGPRADA